MPNPTPRPSHLRLVPRVPATVATTSEAIAVSTAPIPVADPREAKLLRQVADAVERLDELEHRIANTRTARERWVLEQKAAELRAAIDLSTKGAA